MTRRRILVAAALLVSVAAYAFVWSVLRPRVFATSNADFSCFYRAGRMVTNGDGARVYNLHAEHEYDQALGMAATDPDGHRLHLPFVFAPFVLPVFAALSWLSYSDAALLWFAMNVGLLLVWSFLLSDPLHWSNTALALALFAPALFLPATLALLQGQPSIVLLLLFTLVYLDLTNGNDFRAGCWLAMATCKPQFALPMLLALVVWKKWRTIRAFCLSCLILFALSSAVVGWQAVLDYPRALLQFGRLAAYSGGEHPASMPNLRGAASALLPSTISPKATADITIAASLLLLAAMVLLLKRRVRFSALTFSLVMLLSLITSYHSYLHDDVLLLLPILLIATDRTHHRSPFFQAATTAVIAGLLFAPLVPSSLTTTALQMFCLTLGWTLLLGCEILCEGKLAAANYEASGIASVAL